jgi:thymidylate synthase
MKTFPKTNFSHLQSLMAGSLLSAPQVDVGEWQAQKISDPAMVTRELQNTIFELDIPRTVELLQQEVKPNLPWAEDHFQERVSGKPLNPPPSSEWWPHAQQSNKEHTDDYGLFSHTYPERFWPKRAGFKYGDSGGPIDNRGIRYPYGDLDDLVLQLQHSPYTRQAYLPVWFPEDTGSVQGQRVPCTLGYQFLVRERKVHVTYLIRSCDFLRHFPDDVYMAGRLLQWVTEHLDGFGVGTLTMWMGSFHIFEGDVPMLRERY